MSALLSKLLVAYTVEFDNAFERRMRDSGHPGFISHAMWWNFMRFLRDGMTVDELGTEVPMSLKATKGVIGALERWGYVVPVPVGPPPKQVPRASYGGMLVREGFGSGQGISPEWRIRLQPRMVRALEVWPDLSPEVDARWESRFGEAVPKLGAALREAVDRFGVDAPWGLPDLSSPPFGSLPPPSEESPMSGRSTSKEQSVGVLLAQVLYVAAREYNRSALAPIAFGANLLRVVDRTGVPTTELAKRTGLSPFVTQVGYVMKKSGLFEIVSDADTRRKLVRLTPAGARLKKEYEPVSSSIAEALGLEALRGPLEQLVCHPALADGLVPPQAVPRAGDYTPSLDVGWPKALKVRVRNLAKQTDAFIADPEANLPHYPVWDVDRGWGP